jgi:SP family general alpha glucoside:H+ symporter-like MFS transporter
MFVWAFFRLPETWNRTYEELDILFARKVSARKFANTEVNLFEDQEIDLCSRQEAPAVLV